MHMTHYKLHFAYHIYAYTSIPYRIIQEIFPCLRIIRQPFTVVFLQHRGDLQGVPGKDVELSQVPSYL